MNPLVDLKNLGQSIWLDFITRRFMNDGKLDRLIQTDGLSGVTSNPTIFEKAVTGGPEYDDTIRQGLASGKQPPAIFEALAIEDIQRACDAFHPVYEQTHGLDGYVSIEVNPHLARDTQGTHEEARRLWQSVNRPNVMIKIPGTREGLPAIEQTLAQGINVNITLIFALKRYEEVIAAWLAGLNRLAAAGKPLGSVASVASFFVSRVDTLVDKRLDMKMAAAPLEERKRLDALFGKAGIANAQKAYAIFEKMLVSPEFQALEAKGAQPQRPLWASTSTKNPKYRDVMYVEELAGPQTINTLPLATVDAARDHATVRKALPADPAAAEQIFQQLSAVGITMDDVTKQLEEEGIQLFAKSYDELIQSIEKKKEALKMAAR